MSRFHPFRYNAALKLLATSCLLALTSFTSNKQSLMIGDLETIGGVLQAHYAPVYWKQAHMNWVLTDQLAEAAAAIAQEEEPTVQHYHQIIKRLFRSARDYHLSVRFHSTASSSLPFVLIEAEGRYFIVNNEVQQALLQDGDELLTMNDVPTGEVVAQLQLSEFGTADKGTDHSLAGLMLTRRSGSIGSSPPKGSLAAEIRHAKDGVVRKWKFSWHYEPELITHQSSEKAEPEPSFWDKAMITPLFFDLKHMFRKNTTYGLGNREGFLPPFGPPLWEASKGLPFVSYIFTHKKHRIGFIRIPHYSAGSYEAKAFAAIIKHLNNETEALIIDQTNNPGGSVFYLYTIAAILTDKPMKTPKHHLTLTAREAEFAVRAIPALRGIRNDTEAQMVIGQTMGGYPVNKKFASLLLKYCNFIKNEWDAGHYFTDLTHLYGVDEIDPYPKHHYTKPILFLVNELDFSGGDFLPAILQDNKRAVLFGSKTAGAGGFVNRASFPNRYGVDTFYYTASLAERIDHQPIENLGVTPDIPYTITAEDIQNGYRQYKVRVLDAVLEMIEKDGNKSPI